MPAKQVSTIGFNNGDFGIPLTELAKERDALGPEDMAEMLYTKFEQGIEEMESNGVYLPPPTDMNGHVLQGYDQNMVRTASSQNNIQKTSGNRPTSQTEQALLALMEARDDMINDYIDVSRNPAKAASQAMKIQKMEANIISMGGEIDRFDPSNYQSGLASVQDSVAPIDPVEMAGRVVANTQKAYTLKPIESIRTGKSKTGKQGVCIKIASAPGVSVIGTIVPKGDFSGTEVIDYTPDNGKGRMTVKAPINGRWGDVSSNYNIAWALQDSDEN